MSVRRAIGKLSIIREMRTRRRVQASEGVRLPWGCEAGCQVTIGDFTRFSGPFRARGAGTLDIGKYCAIGTDLHVITSNHIMNRANLQVRLQRQINRSTPTSKAEAVRVGHNAWIGDRAILLPGAAVGIGAVIGAGSVVTSSIPDFAIAAGNPARVIRYRFDEATRGFLGELEWWNWSPATIRAREAFFLADFEGAGSLDRIQELLDD